MIGRILLSLLLCSHAASATCASTLLRQDEGQWLFEDAPIKRVRALYNVELDQDWLDHVAGASVKLGRSSGAFVSRDGLVATNYHAIRRYLPRLKLKDLNERGFLAAERDRELIIPGLSVRRLGAVEDVTERLEDGVAELRDEPSRLARREVNRARLVAERERPGREAVVVSLFGGARRHLYTYDVYTDVRLVFVPEVAIAEFGRERLNFEFPRFSFDVAFVRVYAGDGHPLKPEHHLGWSTAPLREHQLVFVSGNAGKTSRDLTGAHLRFRRDVVLARLIPRLEAKLAALAGEDLVETRPERSRLENELKSARAQLRGLNRCELWVAKARGDARADQGALREIDQTILREGELSERYRLVGRGEALDGKLFSFARRLVRRAIERRKPGADRRAAYQDAHRTAAERGLFATVPIDLRAERRHLTLALEDARQTLTPDDPTVRALLGDLQPDAHARALINSSYLHHAFVRRWLAKLPYSLLARVPDPFIKLAFALEEESRALEEAYATGVTRPRERAYRSLGFDRMRSDAQARYPDGTSTLRLSFGRVLGYEQVPAWTEVREVFGRPEGLVPPSWRGLEDSHLPLNFVTTADTVGGSSGSPVLNADGAVVGLHFDSNRERSELRHYLYTDRGARSVAVGAQAISRVLRDAYGAKTLADELGR